MIKAFFLLVFIAPLLVHMGALAADPKGLPSLPTLRAQKVVLKTQIDALNSMKTCFGDGECEAIELGEKACGGPSSWLIVSAQNPNIDEVKKLAGQFTKIEKEMLTSDSNLVSDCSYLMQPNPRCVDKVCSDGKKRPAPAQAPAPPAAATPAAPQAPR